MEIVIFIKELFCKKEVISALVIRNIKARHATSYLGLFWLYCQPIMYMGILYFVFSVGLRSGSVSGVPFIAYLTSGILGWFYFIDCFGSAPNLIKSHGFLVKRVDFRLSILPVVNLIENAVTHVILCLFVMGILWLKGISPTIYDLQLVYYFIAMFLLLLGLSWFVSAINLFVSDMGNIVGILIQFGFWGTPIIWDLNMVPDAYQWIIKINPMYYIVTGYRDSLIYGIPFWERPQISLYFWTVTLIICFLGAIVFRKLRPHFAEVI